MSWGGGVNVFCMSGEIGSEGEGHSTQLTHVSAPWNGAVVGVLAYFFGVVVIVTVAVGVVIATAAVVVIGTVAVDVFVG